MPEEILTRAEELLFHLDRQGTPSIDEGDVPISAATLFAKDASSLPIAPKIEKKKEENMLIRKLKELDINTLSPMEAFMELDALIREAKQEGTSS